jgi:hypothetical protein
MNPKNMLMREGGARLRNDRDSYTVVEGRAMSHAYEFEDNP